MEREVIAVLRIQADRAIADGFNEMSIAPWNLLGLINAAMGWSEATGELEVLRGEVLEAQMELNNAAVEADAWRERATRAEMALLNPAGHA